MLTLFWRKVDVAVVELELLWVEILLETLCLLGIVRLLGVSLLIVVFWRIVGLLLGVALLGVALLGVSLLELLMIVGLAKVVENLRSGLHLSEDVVVGLLKERVG